MRTIILLSVLYLGSLYKQVHNLPKLTEDLATMFGYLLAVCIVMDLFEYYMKIIRKEK